MDDNLQPGEVIINECGIQWASLVPHAVIAFFTMGIWLIPLIYFAVCRSKTHITLTNRRLFGKVGGFFSSDYLDVPLNKVSSIMLENSFMGKILGYATVKVASSSGSCNFDFVKGGREFRDSVNNQIEIYDQERIKKQAMEMAKAMNSHPNVLPPSI
jgi:uncharacterized membrane protein YdbT with pleckstrin-like domain